MNRSGWIKVGAIHAYRLASGQVVAEIERHPEVDGLWVARPMTDRPRCRREGWFATIDDARDWVARERRRR